MKALIVLLLTLMSFSAFGETLTVNPKRTLVLEGEVDGNAVELARTLLDMAADSQEDIYMIINSPGGNVIPGLQLLQAMQIAEHRGLHIRCMVPNLAASMAFVLFAGCTERYAFNASLLLWHPMRAGSRNGFTEEEAKAAAAHMRDLSRPLLRLQWKALGISWKLFYHHYKLETLWTGEALNRTAPGFMTIVDDVEGIANIFKPAGNQAF